MSSTDWPVLPARPCTLARYPRSVQIANAVCECSGSQLQSVEPSPSAATPWTRTVTRMSSSWTSVISVRLNASSAALVDTYIDSIGNGSRVDSLEVFTMSPPPAARSSGIAARHVSTGPRKLVWSCVVMSWSESSSTRHGRYTAALFTSTSTRPKRPPISANARCTPATSPTSVGMATARSPSRRASSSSRSSPRASITT